MTTDPTKKCAAILNQLVMNIKCAICLGPTNNVVELKCKHRYCSECFKTHCTRFKAQICPTCRKEYPKRTTFYRDNFSDNLSKFIESATAILNHENEGESSKLEKSPLRRKKQATKFTLVQEKEQKKKCQTSDELFDLLHSQKDDLCFNKKNLKTYPNKKNSPRAEELDLENRTRIKEWLNNSPKELDKVTQAICSNPSQHSIDLPSISQLEMLPLPTRKKSRSRSIDSQFQCTSKLVPVASPKSSEELDNYHIEEEEPEEKKMAKEIEKRVLLDLLENECLKNYEMELKKNKGRRGRKKKAEEEKSGWGRVKDLNETVNPKQKAPKKLNIVVQNPSNTSETDKQKFELQGVAMALNKSKKREFLTEEKKEFDLDVLETFISNNINTINLRRNITEMNQVAIKGTEELLSVSEEENEEEAFNKPTQIRTDTVPTNSIVSNVNIDKDLVVLLEKEVRKNDPCQLEEEFPAIAEEAEDLDEIFSRPTQVYQKSDPEPEKEVQVLYEVADINTNQSFEPQSCLKLNASDKINNKACTRSDILKLSLSNSKKTVNEEKVRKLSTCPDLDHNKENSDVDILDLALFSNNLFPFAPLQIKNDSAEEALEKVNKNLIEAKNKLIKFEDHPKYSQLVTKNLKDYFKGFIEVFAVAHKIILKDLKKEPKVCEDQGVQTSIELKSVEVNTDEFWSKTSSKESLMSCGSKIISDRLRDDIVNEAKVPLEVPEVIEAEKLKNKISMSGKGNKDKSDTILDVTLSNSDNIRSKSSKKSLFQKQRQYKRIRTYDSSDSESEKSSKKPCNKLRNNEDELVFDSDSLAKTDCSESLNYEGELERFLKEDVFGESPKTDPTSKKSSTKEKKPESKTTLNIQSSEKLIQEATKSISTKTVNSKETSLAKFSEDWIFDENNLSKLDKEIEKHTKTEVSTPKRSEKLEIEDSPLSIGVFDTSQDSLKDILNNDSFDNIVEMKDSNHEEPDIKKIKILQDIKIMNPSKSDFSDDLDKCDKISSDEDIIDTTPQKKTSSIKRKRSSEIKLSKEINTEEMLNSTFPPPPEFQDFDMDETLVPEEEKELKTDLKQFSRSSFSSKEHCTPVSKKSSRAMLGTSTPHSYINPSEESLNFSPIPKDSSPKPIPSLSKYPPLSVNKSKDNIMACTPGQKSIWNYVKKKDNSADVTLTPQTASKPNVTCTRIQKREIAAICSLANKQLVTYSSDFSPSVTHLIVSVNEDNCLLDQTIKYVSAVASGVWVLSFRWIEKCIETNSIIAEEPYEVRDISGLPGPRISRLTRSSNPLLKDYKFYIAQPLVCTTERVLGEIIRNLGGRVVDFPQQLMEKDGRFGLIVSEGRATQDFNLFEDWFIKYRALTVEIQWLFASIGKYKLANVRPHLLSPEYNIMDLNYPNDLIESVPITCTESEAL